MLEGEGMWQRINKRNRFEGEGWHRFVKHVSSK